MKFNHLQAKSIFACIILVITLSSCKNREKSEALTAQDYENATLHLSKNMNRYVYNTMNRGFWTGDSLFTYQKKTRTGKEFIVVNTSANTRIAAFDHERLAAVLSDLLNKKVSSDSLPFNLIDHRKDGKFGFRIDRTYYVCDPADYSISEEKQNAPSGRYYRNELVSPDGSKSAFIRDYNLWVKDLNSGKEKQLTTDGKIDYGYATNNTGWTKSDGPVLKWSPDSRKIATFKQDARNVGEMYLTSTNVGHPKLQAWKHPLPGDSIVFKLERVIIHLDNNPKVVRLNMPSDFQRSTITDHVADWNGELLDAEWKEDGSEFAFVSSSRDHKIAELKIANANTGEVRSIHKEVTETYFESGVDKVNWHVLFDSDEFIWYSEKDDWGHLYLYDLNSGDLKNRITKGAWQVQQVSRIDQENRVIYFTAGGKEEGNPYYQYLYKVNFDGSNLICLTPDKGHHQTQISPSWKYIIDTYSSTTAPPKVVLRDMEGKQLLELETADISDLKANGWIEPIEFTVKARDNKTDLYGLLCLPGDYDDSKSYPVLNYIYPGPQSGSIGNYSFRTAYSDFQALADLGFAVMAVDAMGTPGRSKSFHDAYYGNMGDNGLPDNITAIKQLAERYKGLDTTRVGIWGHSGGGFASTAALLRYPDFYKVGVSGAGNHDNRNYEADWGEKWQGLLTTNADGTTNYDDQANQNLAKNLKGKLLITHGSMDDNVPPSNTLLVVEALIKANKDFDLIIFPNKGHGYGDMTNYMTRRRWDYFVKHLLHKDPPLEFTLDKY